MPSFLASGLISIRATIGVSEAFREVCHQKLELYTPDVTVVALIDTGSSMTVVDRSVIEGLRVHHKEERPVHVLGETKRYPSCDTWLKVLGRDGAVLVNEPNHPVLCADLASQEYRAILGMDVLQSFTLRMNHAAGIVELAPT